MRLLIRLTCYFPNNLITISSNNMKDKKGSSILIRIVGHKSTRMASRSPARHRISTYRDNCTIPSKTAIASLLLILIQPIRY